MEATKGFEFSPALILEEPDDCGEQSATRSFAATVQKKKLQPITEMILSEVFKSQSENQCLSEGSQKVFEKIRGEKVSLFSKIFGRKKKSSSAGTGTVSTSSGGGTQSTEMEYATFSGQFPPPEWMRYQQQLERQRRTEEWVSQQLPKSATWGHLNGLGNVLSSGVAEPGSVEVARTESLQPYTQHPAQLPSGQSSQGHVYATLGHLPGASAVVNGVRGGRGEEEQRKMKQQHRMIFTSVEWM